MPRFVRRLLRSFIAVTREIHKILPRHLPAGCRDFLYLPLPQDLRKNVAAGIIIVITNE